MLVFVSFGPVLSLFLAAVIGIGGLIGLVRALIYHLRRLFGRK